MATHSSMLAWEIPWTEEPGQRATVHGLKESDLTQQLKHHHHHQFSWLAGYSPVPHIGTWQGKPSFVQARHWPIETGLQDDEHDKISRIQGKWLQDAAGPQEGVSHKCSCSWKCSIFAPGYTGPTVNCKGVRPSPRHTCLDGALDLRVPGCPLTPLSQYTVFTEAQKSKLGRETWEYDSNTNYVFCLLH